ncbi:MAG TPA: hypothetical protein VGS41_08740, partial [Chthonomonadales bacterium]|nr:hypothetical protein [Chthonomonadales bacterium]
AAEMYYATGESVSASQMKRLYREAYLASREKVKQLAKAVAKPRETRLPASRKRQLPPPRTATDPSEPDSAAEAEASVST